MLNADHKLTAGYSVARSKVAKRSADRKHRVAPSVDHKRTGKHMGKHSAAPPEVKAPVRVAAFSEDKRRTVAGEVMQLVEDMRLGIAGQPEHAVPRDTPHVRDQGSASAEPQHHKAIAALAAPGR